MTIESTQVVYLVAPAGTGKSFSGDYLQVVHGYKHVDGDIPIKSMIIPKYREMIKERIATNGKSPSYYEEIAKQTIDAAKDHDRVVLTHATYYQESRDVVIDTLIDGGICRENITVIQLIIDPVVKLRCLYHRTKRQFEHKGKTIEDMFTNLQYEGNELTEEKFIKAMMEQQNGDMAPNGMEFEDCPMAIKVDVSDRVDHLSNLDEALALTRSSEDWAYETICAQVIPKMFKEMKNLKQMEVGIC